MSAVECATIALVSLCVLRCCEHEWQRLHVGAGAVAATVGSGGTVATPCSGNIYVYAVGHSPGV